jgi:hypothetical protein
LPKDAERSSGPLHHLWRHGLVVIVLAHFEGDLSTVTNEDDPAVFVRTLIEAAEHATDVLG